MGYLARTYEHYKGLPHQREAIAKLEGMISPEVIDAFRKVFSPERQRKLILQVPFFSQLDNDFVHGRNVVEALTFLVANDLLFTTARAIYIRSRDNNFFAR